MNLWLLKSGITVNMNQLIFPEYYYKIKNQVIFINHLS